MIQRPLRKVREIRGHKKLSPPEVVLKNLFLALLALQPALSTLFVPRKPANRISRIIADRDPVSISDRDDDLIGHHRYYGRATRP